MLRFFLIFIPAFLILANHLAHAQTPVTDCGNLGAETGTWLGWEGLHGKWSADKPKQAINVLSEMVGIDSQYHRIRTKADGFLPEITDEKIPYVPPGSEYAIQLGNSRNGAEYERLVTSFVVDSTNSMFQYQFAVIFEDPDHEEIEQPKFEVLVLDQQGNTVPCGFYQVTAGGNIPGFKSQGVVRYRNWTTAAVDLRAYIGQIITLHLSTYDCSQGGHWGMALFDAACIRPRITLEDYCPGKNNTVTLEAPEGFKDYQWSTGDTTRVITLANAAVGQQLEVKFSPFSSLNDGCTLSLSLTVPAKVEIVLPDSVGFCQGGQAEIIPSLPKENSYTYKWYPGGETSKNLTVKSAGLYRVEATKGDCVLRDTVAAVVQQPPAIAFDPQTPSCEGKSDGALKANVHYPEPLMFLWSTGDKTPAVQNLAPGVYSVSVTGAKSGCGASAQYALPQPEKVQVNAQLLRVPGCHNWPGGGEAAANATGGAPPYHYKWDTGAGTPISPIPRGGLYLVTATDAKGCEGIDSVRVIPLKTAALTTGNYCHDGKKGTIELSGTGGQPPYLYRQGGGAFSPKAVFEGLANGPYGFQVQDGNGCIDTLTAIVHYMREDTFKVHLTPDTSVLLGQHLTVGATANYPIKTIEWHLSAFADPVPDALEQSFQPMTSGEISVFAEDAFGCRSEADMMVTVLKEYGKYIPNVFTPTGGQHLENSRFYMSANMEQIKTVPSFRVFDRWGNKVFEDFDYVPNDVAQGWDGIFEGKPALPGVYVYRVEIEYIDGHREVAAGDVTLIR